MTTDADEEALSWDGEKADPSLATGREPKAPKTSKSETAADVAPDTTTDVTEPAAKPAMSSFLLVSYGILAGAYLLFIVGWVVGIGQVVPPTTDVLSKIMGAVLRYLAILSPAIWFGVVFFLTCQRKPLQRLLLLLIGLVVIAPWPFILLGATR